MNDPLVNQQFGNYFIQQRLQSGGMAVVYKAFDQRRQQLVALKILQENYADKPQLVLRFRREAEIAQRLSHPNIVPFYDFGEFNGRLYLTMRFMEGGSLVDRLQQVANVSLGQAARWLRQIAGALDFAHHEGVIHRDLKIGNILLTESGEAYLSDFGIARITEATQQITQPGQQMPGTVRYMSPEQANNDPRLDHRSDIYSFGIIAYLLVTGHFPFTGPDQVVIHQHLNVDPPKPSVINSDLPPALDAVLLKALAKNPDQRYRSAGEFVTAVEKAIAGYADLLVIVDPRGARPISSTMTKPQPIYANRLVWGVLAVIAAVIAVLAVLSSSGGGSNDETVDPRAAAQATFNAQNTSMAEQAAIVAQLATIAQESTQTALAVLGVTPTPSNTASATVTHTPTETPTPSNTASATSTATLTAPPTENWTATAVQATTNAAATQAVVEATRQANQATEEQITRIAQLTANAPTNTAPPTVTPSYTITPTNTPTSTLTPSATATNTATPSNTSTITPSATATLTHAPTNTVTATVTERPTDTLARTATRTPRPTRTLLPTSTATTVPSPTAANITPTITTTPEPCYVHAEQTDVAIRVGPGENRGVRSYMPVNQGILVVGVNTDNAGNTWWKIQPPGYVEAEADRYWVAGADVAETGDCDRVGEATASILVPDISAIVGEVTAEAGGEGFRGTWGCTQLLVGCEIVFLYQWDRTYYLYSQPPTWNLEAGPSSPYLVGSVASGTRAIISSGPVGFEMYHDPSLRTRDRLDIYRYYLVLLDDGRSGWVELVFRTSDSEENYYEGRVFAFVEE